MLQSQCQRLQHARPLAERRLIVLRPLATALDSVETCRKTQLLIRTSVHRLLMELAKVEQIFASSGRWFLPRQRPFFMRTTYDARRAHQLGSATAICMGAALLFSRFSFT